MEETPSAKTYVGWAITILGGLAVLAAVLLALWHVFLWLRDGIWPTFSGGAMLAAVAIPYPATPWPWVQNMIDWLLAWSAAGLLTCAGILLAIVGTFLTSEYDQKLAASKAARAAFAPAGDAGRAARRETNGVDEDDLDGVDDDADEEEPEEPPPPPPRTFLQAATDHLLGCGCIVLLFVVGLGLFIGWDYFDRTHYNRVSAHILTVTPSCVLEWEAPRDPLPWESSRPRRSEDMACADARRQARGYSPRAIERLAVTYTYTSPVDGRTYPGRLHRDAIDFPPGVRAGGEMPVYSLKADPGRSRGLYRWPVD